MPLENAAAQLSDDEEETEINQFDSLLDDPDSDLQPDEGSASGEDAEESAPAEDTPETDEGEEAEETPETPEEGSEESPEAEDEGTPANDTEDDSAAQAAAEDQPPETEEEGEQAPVQEQAQQPPPMTQEEYATKRQGWVDKLTENYQLSEDEATQFLTEPETIVPQALAKLHVTLYEQLSQAFQQALPQAIQQTTTQTQTAKQNEDAFFEAWPKLRGRDDDLARITQMYRQQNPDAPVEKAIKEIGALAHITLGIPMEDQGTESREQGQPSGRPAPRKPAKAGGGAPPAPKETAADKNVYSQMAAQIEQEDI